MCNILGVDYAGTAVDISERLCAHLVDLDKLLSAEDADDEEEDVEDIATSLAGEVQLMREFDTPKFTMSYRDVEDTLRVFSGVDNYPVEAWVSYFEETALLLRWRDVEKLIFAKKSLKDLAKLFIQSERGIKSWEEMKNRLLDEFSIKINSAQLHRMLRERRMKADESVQHYYLAMKELASRGNIKPDAVIQYIIDGIPDDPANKQCYMTQALWQNLKPS